MITFHMSNIEAVEARIRRLCIGAVSTVWLRIEALRELSRLRAAWDIISGIRPAEQMLTAVKQVQDSGRDGLQMIELANEIATMTNPSFDALVAAWTADASDDFVEASTVLIPHETMSELVYGDGYAAIGPRCTTRDMRSRTTSTVADYKASV